MLALKFRVTARSEDSGTAPSVGKKLAPALLAEIEPVEWHQESVRQMVLVAEVVGWGALLKVVLPERKHRLGAVVAVKEQRQTPQGGQLRKMKVLEPQNHHRRKQPYPEPLKRPPSLAVKPRVTTDW